MSPKLSIFMPSIRTHLLEKWYETVSNSCNRHSFEVVVCGPFDPPESLLKKSNFKFIKDYGSPTRAAQIAAINCQGEFLYHTTDDCVYFENLISNELDSISENCIVGMRYREGFNHSGKELPPNYWYALSAYPGFRYVDSRWLICVHFLMSNEIFRKFGGFDCEYQYLNHATHCLLFRIQANANVICKLSANEISSADWYESTTVDHAPIHYAQTEYDAIKFIFDWHYNDGRLKRVDINNWQGQPAVWKMRFGNNLPKSYEEMGYR